MISTRMTPVMGWNSWNAFRCYDATEDAILAHADQLIALGLADAGYDTIVVDDCWQAPTRAPDGGLRAHPERFPSGMGALGKEVRARGLKFGMYLAPGRRTCAQIYDAYGRDCRCPLTTARARLSGFFSPGSESLGSWQREEDDLAQVLDWGIDYLKYDWCQGGVGTGRASRLWRDRSRPQEAFERMSALVEAADREIYYSISEYGKFSPWNWAPAIANSWRTTPDIAPSSRSVFTIAARSAAVAWAAGPGRIGDADMLQVGNFDEADGGIGPNWTGDVRGSLDYAHVAMWAFLAAPLMVGTDLRRLTPESPVVTVLTDPALIAINQDTLVEPGRIVATEGRGAVRSQLWRRRLQTGEVTMRVTVR